MDALTSGFLTDCRRLAGENGSLFIRCTFCGEDIEDLRDVHVHHREPFQGLDDPRRLDVNNLRVTHKSCHMRGTAEQRHHSEQRPPME